MLRKVSVEGQIGRKQQREVRFSERVAPPRPTSSARVSQEKTHYTPQQGRSPGQLSNKKSPMLRLREMSRSTKMHYSGMVLKLDDRNTTKRRAVDLGNSNVSAYSKSFYRVTKAGESDVNLVESMVKQPEVTNYSSERLRLQNESAETDELQRQIHRKQEEMELIKEMHAQEKKRLTDELYYMNLDRRQLAKRNKYLYTRQRELDNAVNRLQREITYYQSHYSRNTVSVTYGTIESGLPSYYLPSADDCHKMKEDLYRLTKKLQHTEHLNIKYEAMVCDLHLYRRFLREQLELTGHSRNPYFLRAYQKLLRSQAHRKKLL